MDSGKENEKIIYFFLHFLFPVHVSFPERKKTEERGENKKENIFSTSFFVVSRDSKYVIIDTMYSRKFGRCYSIQFAKEIVKQGIAEIGFLSKMNTYIYFHHPGRITLKP